MTARAHRAAPRSSPRIEGVDAGYLYMETPTMHMHTLKVALVEPTPGLDFERFREGVLSRLQQLPSLRRRVLPVPFALNHPVWVADREIDPDRHFFRHRVGGEGLMSDLNAVIGTIASTPLDRSGPLWELHLCEGLADGRIAIVGKIHHSLADGAAANALLASVTDVRAPDVGDEARQVPPRPALSETPSRVELVASALRDAIVQIGLLPSLLWRTAAGVLSMLRYRRSARPDVPRPVLDAPRVSFNGPLTARRGFATCTLPLEEIKEIRRAHEGVTLNDVVLAVVSGALRRWMAERGEVPSGSLIAGVPVATEAPGQPVRLSGNRVSNLFTSLATDVEDPHERLRTISRVTAQSKMIQKKLGLSMLTEWVQFTPPAPFAALMRLYSRARGASLHSAPFNVIVSNVPGPREPATIGGALLSDLFSVGPILEGIGLNVTVWSYVDRMNFSVLTCPDLLPDLEPLVAQFRPALDELRP